MEDFKPKSAGCIIKYGSSLYPDVLVVRQRYDKDEDGKFGFPKGHIDGNETSRITAKREVSEETGICVDTSYSNYFYNNSSIFYLINLTVRTPPKVHDRLEISGSHWMNINHLIYLYMLDNIYGGKSSINYSINYYITKKYSKKYGLDKYCSNYKKKFIKKIKQS